MKPQKIINIKYVGIQQTYDIEVDNNSHIFYGNGIATSNSHAVAYAYYSYYLAYIKAHDPIKFFTESLNEAHNKPNKMEEIKELIMDAKLFGIEVYPPSLDMLYEKFKLDRSKNIIYYGYTNAKNIGAGERRNIKEAFLEAEKTLDKDRSDFTWMDCLIHIGENVKSKAFISLISIGALNGPNNKESRSKMLYEFNIFNELSNKEKEFAINYRTTNKDINLAELFKAVINGHKITSRRIKVVMSLYDSLVNPPYSLEDQLAWVADTEEMLLGCALSCAKVDGAISDVNLSCNDIASGNARLGRGACMAVKLNRVHEYTTKDGNIMAFVTGEDSSGETSGIVLFSDQYTEFKKLLFIGNTVLLYGEVKSRGKDLSLNVNKVSQI